MAQETSSFEFKDENARFGIRDEWMNKPLHIGGQKQQTAVEWLVQIVSGPLITIPQDVIDKAKQMEKEQMIEFAEFVASYPNKNRNYLGELLHAKSKYDEAERTVDLLEEYYNETYNK